MVNELVINGYVYAEMEMPVDNSCKLSAVVNGHRIQAGSKHIGTCCYIDVDGNQIAKKIRWY